MGELCSICDDDKHDATPTDKRLETMSVLAPSARNQSASVKLQPHLMMMPLSMEKESVGSPAMFQARIATWSPRIEIRLKSREHGIPFSCR